MLAALPCSPPTCASRAGRLRTGSASSGSGSLAPHPITSRRDRAAASSWCTKTGRFSSCSHARRPPRPGGCRAFAGPNRRARARPAGGSAIGPRPARAHAPRELGAQHAARSSRRSDGALRRARTPRGRPDRPVAPLRRDRARDDRRERDRQLPQRLRGVPVPTASMLRRTLDALCGDGRSIALGLFDQGGLWTSFVARRRARFRRHRRTRRDSSCARSLVRRLAPGLPPLRARGRRTLRAARIRVFAELGTFRALQTDPRAGVWSRAVAVRDIVIAPILLRWAWRLG